MGLSRAQRHPNNGFSTRWVSFFCALSFLLGFLLVNRFGAINDLIETDEDSYAQKPGANELLPFVNCDNKDASALVSQTNDVIATFDKTISSLEIQLAAAKAFKAESEKGSSVFTETETYNLKRQQKVFCVMGIMTSFSNIKRRDSVRETWLPRWGDLMKLDKEKGIIIRFVIGYSASSGGVQDQAIDAEEEQHKDFLRLQNLIEDYHELSLKTQVYFSTAVAIWDAEFYVKVDDDVHVNIGMLSSTLARHRSKSRVYIGCMKSGPVLAEKGIKYQEPEHWKFGEGNKYFRHATGQIYGISKDLATYIADNRHILHRYANEDVTLGSWLIGLDVEHIDERSLCCATPHDCEWKAQAGNPCAASFDWSCSGICKSEDRMEEVHQHCGEGDETIWSTHF